jgi:ATP-binding cassette subfamily B protein
VFYSIAWLYGSYVQHSAALIETQGILKTHAEQVGKKTYRLPKSWKYIQLSNLFFSYNETDNEGSRHVYHLHDVGLTLSRKEKIAFIGASGSGKSTMLSILRGLHVARVGDLSVDGVIQKRGIEHLYSETTLVPQDPEIFNSSIKDNITMEVAVTKKDLDKAILAARFDVVVKRLIDGLETNVMEKGVSLSGGEKQRLALARGILAARNSDIILFDEPTSSVDAANEYDIYMNLFKMFKHKTFISTIHRLHLLEKFDRIYMFEDGKVIAEGTLDHLHTVPEFQVMWKKYHKAKK